MAHAASLGIGAAASLMSAERPRAFTVHLPFSFRHHGAPSHVRPRGGQRGQTRGLHHVSTSEIVNFLVRVGEARSER